MHQRVLNDEITLGLQHLHDLFVCHLDMLSLEVWHLVREKSSLVYRAWRHLVCCNDARSDGNTVIIVAESWRLMDDTGTAVRGDICVVQDLESSIAILIGNQRQMRQ